MTLFHLKMPGDSFCGLNLKISFKEAGMRIFLSIFLCSFFCSSNAQTLAKWAQTVHWDGVSHWSKYIRSEAGYMGPNALPVPFIGNGSIDSSLSFTATANLHFTKGDKTQNPALYGNYCLVKNVISFDMYWIPFEYYKMSNAIKEERHVYYTFFSDKKARGDIYINTNIQLLNKWRKNIHLVLRAGFRYPSSSDLGAARYTDGMGYYFDLSFGKPIGATGLKWIGMLGFYCWQVDLDRFRQNDAPLFGTGLEWNPKGWKLQSSVSGYKGYMEQSRDKPIVFRVSAEKRINKNILLIRMQQGLHDFKYTSVEFGGKYIFK